MPIALRWLLSASERDQTIWTEKLNYHIFNCICWIRYINCIFYSTSQSKIRSEMDSSHWQKVKYQQRKECPSTGFHARKKDDVQEGTIFSLNFGWNLSTGSSLYFWKQKKISKPNQIFPQLSPYLLQPFHSNPKALFCSGLIRCRSRTQPPVTTLVPKPFLLSP